MTGKTERPGGKFFRRATIWLPTWRSWLLLVLLIGLPALGLGRRLHQFLSVQAPVSATVLVAEGWLPDYGLEAAVEEFGRGGYEYLVTAGGPLERGKPLYEYRTYAGSAAAILRRLGAPADRVLEAPAPATLRNRTYQSAVSVRAFLAGKGLQPAGLNVISHGPHARRTLTVYRKVFEGHCPVGIRSVPPSEYDPEHWWKSSEGVKSTIAETLGWLHEWVWSSGR